MEKKIITIIIICSILLCFSINVFSDNEIAENNILENETNSEANNMTLWEQKTEVDNKLISSSLEFKEEFFRIFKKYANSKSNYEFSSSVIYVNNISVENAKKFAEELYDVINTIVG